ncbi:MAG: hypothetical protein K8S87_06885, partial [Planctomycetes bacterium]|nr:hypothetical protein [Planctomycetota bacterium]
MLRIAFDYAQATTSAMTGKDACPTVRSCEIAQYKQLYECCSSIFCAELISYQFNSKVKRIYLHNACKTLHIAKLMP